MTVGTVAGYGNSNPYIGIRPFSASDGEKFYGRDREAAELAELWAGRSLTLLAGPSGAGKTSLLVAGVLPRVARSGVEVLPVGRPAGVFEFPRAALPRHNPFTLGLLASWAPAVPPNRLAGLSVEDFLRRRERDAGPDGAAVPMLVAVDQAEEVFEGEGGARREAERDAFLLELRAAVERVPGLRLLVVVRDDHLDRVGPALGAAERFSLGALRVTNAVDVVVRSAEGGGRWFQPGVAARIVAEVAGGGGAVEPVLLQAVCSRLWEALPGRVHEITMEDVRAHAGVEGALTAFCGEAVMRVAAEHGFSALRLASWLQQAFAGGAAVAGGAVPAGAVPVDGVGAAGVPIEVLRGLERRNLLRREEGAYRLRFERLGGPLARLDVGELRMGEVTAEGCLAASALALARGDLGQAERDAEAALDLGGEADLPLRARAESRLGDIAHERGDPALAVVRYRTAATLFETLQDVPAVARLLAALGRALHAQGRDIEAITSLRAAVDRLPGDLALQVELGRTLWQVGQGRAGLAVLTEVLNAHSDTPAALRARGEMLADLGEVQAALRDLRRAGKFLHPEVLAARALASAAVGDLPDAEEDLAAALAAAPASGPVLLYAARVRALAGDGPGAAELAGAALAATDPAVSAPQRTAARRLTGEE